MTNRKLNRDIVWKDSWLKDFGIWFWLVPILVFSIAIIIVWNQGIISRVGFGAILAFSIYNFCLHLFSTKVALSYSGVLTAKMVKVKLGVFKVRQKNIFISWSDVDSIAFENYLSGAAWVKYPRPYLIVKTKNMEKYIYIVHDIPNFLRTIKKLNKYSLLTKETKEKYK